MALPRSMFRPDTPTAVEMPAPLSCIFLLRPLKPKLRAEWEHRKGLNLEGFADSGDSRTIRASFDPAKDLAANVWLVRQLVTGWDGLMDFDKGGDEQLLPFSDHALETIGSDYELFELIRAAADKLYGRRVEAESGN